MKLQPALLSRNTGPHCGGWMTCSSSAISGGPSSSSPSSSRMGASVCMKASLSSSVSHTLRTCRTSPTSHTAWLVGDVLHVLNVWDTEEDNDAFMQTLAPILEELGLELDGPPEMGELLQVIQPPQ